MPHAQVSQMPNIQRRTENPAVVRILSQNTHSEPGTEKWILCAAVSCSISPSLMRMSSMQLSQMSARKPNEIFLRVAPQKEQGGQSGLISGYWIGVVNGIDQC